MAALELYSTPLLDKAIAYYRMEGATDTKGSYNLTVTDATLAAAKFNNGYTFSGTAQYARCSIPVPTGSFTITGWIKVTDIADIRTMLGWSNSDATKYAGLMIASGKARFSFAQDATKVDSTTSITNNVWTFIAGRFDTDANTMAVWINDEKVSAEQTGTLDVAGGGAGVGCLGTYVDSALMKGQLDDVAYFNTALSDNEISNLYTGDWGGGWFHMSI